MLHTSEVPFNASEHGTQRRIERGITIRDLKSAVKYGIKEAGHNHPITGQKRWKYTYMDIVYITDETSSVEVTSYPLPLPLDKVNLTAKMIVQFNEGKRRINENPIIITSHTVLVVDQSASMINSDMNGHRTRSRAAYFTLAQDYIATKLQPMSTGNVFGNNFTEVITLIEMHDEPELVFRYEPISWVLFNKFVELSEQPRAKSHGNYIPSLKVGLSLLSETPNSKSILSLFFLTDGAPSDHVTGYTNKESILNILNILVKYFTDNFRDRFTFAAVGFGKADANFDILNEMVNQAKLNGSACSFFTTNDCSSLRTALSTVVSSTTSLISKFSKLNYAVGDNNNRIKADLNKAEASNINSKLFNTGEWDIYIDQSYNKKSNVSIGRSDWKYTEENGTWKGNWASIKYKHPDSVGFAVKKTYFGEGAERYVSEMVEIDRTQKPVGERMVAKQSKYLLEKSKYGESNEQEFHKVFMKTQRRAQNWAKKFNRRLDQYNVNEGIPRIEFLSCSSYYIQDDTKDKYYLAENMLDHNLYTKWNDNCGGVDGVILTNPINYFETVNLPLDDLVECSDEEDGNSDEDAVEQYKTTEQINTVDPEIAKLENEILPCDIPQAFTHFTHKFSKRSEMVCDLQGVLSYENGKPLFKLTDPCIHFVDKYGMGNKKNKYGRTDKGEKGMHEFYKTHQCNSLCKILNIYKKN